MQQTCCYIGWNPVIDQVEGIRDDVANIDLHHKRFSFMIFGRLKLFWCAIELTQPGRVIDLPDWLKFWSVRVQDFVVPPSPNLGARGVGTTRKRVKF